MEHGCLGGTASGERRAYGSEGAWAFLVCVGAAVTSSPHGVDRERDGGGGNGIGHDVRERDDDDGRTSVVGGG